MDVTNVLGRFHDTRNLSLHQGDSPAQLREVAQEFESLFVKMMFNAMLDTRNKTDNLTHGGMAEDIFEDMLYTEYSRIIARQGDFAIADMITYQFQRNYDS